MILITQLKEWLDEIYAGELVAIEITVDKEIYLLTVDVVNDLLLDGILTLTMDFY